MLDYLLLIKHAFFLLLSFVLVFISIPVILNVADRKQIYTSKGGRHVHKEEVSNLGGMGIFMGVLFSYSFYLDISGVEGLSFLVSAMLIIFGIGVKDDILVTAPVVKLAGQILAATLVVLLGDIRITELHLLGHELVLNYAFSSSFSVFFIVLVMNSFNLIDGVDGLASSLGIVSVSSITLWFIIKSPGVESTLGVITIGALLAFLYFNLFSRTRKIFMGDTGSLLLGFIASVLAILFIEASLLNHDFKSLIAVESAPALVISTMIIPLVDVLRVFVIRVLRGGSPFKADKSHVHHRLLTLGLSHLQVTLVLVLVGIGFIVLTWFLQGFENFLLLTMNLGLALLVCEIPSLLIRLKRKRMVRQYRGEAAC